MMAKGEANAIDRHVGRRVFQLRTDRGLTQRQLAAAIGTTYQQLQKYEKGVNRIGAGRLYAIAQALDVPVPLFFQGIADSERVAPLEGAPRPTMETALADMIPDTKARRAIAGLCEAVAQSKR